LGFRAWPLSVAFVSMLCALALAGCSSGPSGSGALVSGMVIDHYTLGDRIDCEAYLDPTCDDYLQVAMDEATTDRGVGAAAIVGHHFYSESIPGTSSGRSSVVIVVFDLANGARAAVGVYCGVGPCQVVRR
jgi:hypothetical protein